MPAYRERLRPPFWLFFALALLIPGMLLIFLPIDSRVGVVAAIVVYAAAVTVAAVAVPSVEVTRSELVAKGARLPLSLTGAVSVHRGEEASLERGQRLDSRAWLVIRGGLDAVVRVEVADDRDPAPYWLISSRRPDELAAAIEAGRAGTFSP
jgi:hypothetical protein